MAWNKTGSLKGPPASESISGTVELATESEALAGVDNVRVITPARAKAIVDAAQVGKGYVRGESGKTYQIVSVILRNTGTGFAILDDPTHNPIGVSSVTQDANFITVNYNFTALNVNTAAVTPDETFGRLGYTLGPSVGLDSLLIGIGQPGGIADYIYSNGSAWLSLNGIMSVSAFNTTTGAIDLTHQDVGTGIIGGSATSRSYTNRATLDSMGATTTRLYLVNGSGVTAKAHSSDHRIWVQRTGTRIVDPSELTQTNSNIWVFAMCEV